MPKIPPRKCAACGGSGWSSAGRLCEPCLNTGRLRAGICSVCRREFYSYDNRYELLWCGEEECRLTIEEALKIAGGTNA